MTQPAARVIADSCTEAGHRLTTIEVTTHRFVLAELNTHRLFSRNSASSRAIPFHKQLTKVTETPAVPVVFPAEQAGMQGGASFTGHDLVLAKRDWLEARDAAVEHAQRLADLGVHKSVVNRLLEPFMWHTAICTATDWRGFWWQRCHEAAQPELRVAADAMLDAYSASQPRLVADGEWHLPYFADQGGHEDDWSEAAKLAADRGIADTEVACRVSAARCARVSYLTQDGRRDMSADLALWKRLRDRDDPTLWTGDPPHASPLEHPATPWADNCQNVELPNGVVMENLPKVGNLTGWVQLRHLELAF